MLEIENLHRPGLSPVSLRIDDGECLALMGPSGSGKSLILRAVADLDPNEGRVRANGDERAQTPAPLWRQKVGFLPAQSGWWGETVGDHIKKSDIVLDLLHKLHLPDESLNWPVSRLSTGETQRLALIRLLAQSPKVLLLDEPTSALDETARQSVEAVLRARLSSGVSILMTTHDEKQAKRLCQRIFRINKGVVTEAFS